jgi:hypothetical protein
MIPFGLARASDALLRKSSGQPETQAGRTRAAGAAMPALTGAVLLDSLAAGQCFLQSR